MLQPGASFGKNIICSPDLDCFVCSRITMKVLAALLILAFAAYCQAADKNFGETCTKDDKCLGDTECKIAKGCTQSACTCKSGYIRNTGNTCKQLKKYDEACSAASDCYTGICTSSKCACASGTVASDNKMTCGRFVGMACTTDANCGTNMQCASSKCACKSAFKEMEKQCVGYYLDESCAGGKTCQFGTCTSDKCSCTNSLVAYAKMYCIHASATKDVGEGSTCLHDLTASAKYCKSGLVCGTCPGSTTKVCMSGAASMKAGVLSTLLAMLITFIRR